MAKADLQEQLQLKSSLHYLGVFVLFGVVWFVKRKTQTKNPVSSTTYVLCTVNILCLA